MIPSKEQDRAQSHGQNVKTSEAESPAENIEYEDRFEMIQTTWLPKNCRLVVIVLSCLTFIALGTITYLVVTSAHYKENSDIFEESAVVEGFELNIKESDVANCSVLVNLTNTHNRTYFVLRWESPFETELMHNVFRISGAIFSGRIVERFNANLSKDSVVALEAGESIINEVNLCAYYNFPESKTYKIRAMFDMMLVDAATAEALKSTLDDGFTESDTSQHIIGSNVIELFVHESMANQEKVVNSGDDSVKVRAPRDLSSVVHGKHLRMLRDYTFYLPRTRNCNSAQVETVRKAQNSAYNTAIAAESALRARSNINRWFGSEATLVRISKTCFTSFGIRICVPKFGQLRNFEGGRLADARLRKDYGTMKRMFDNADIIYDCSPPLCESTWLAYVYGTSTSNKVVHLCSSYFDSMSDKTRGEIMIHELSHFHDVAATEDWVYGFSKSLDLASSDPKKARENADNREYYSSEV